MAKTWQNVLDEARVILNDTEATSNRYTNTMLLAKLNRGLQELGRLRPDAFWAFFDVDDVKIPLIVAVGGDANPDTDTAAFDETEDAEIALDQPFNLPMLFYSSLVYWVAGSAELVDDEFTVDGRAMTLLSQFKAMVVSL